MDTSQLEYSVIGAICIDPRICDKISSILSPDDFSISACGEVYEAACDALSRGKNFDAVIAADAIRNRVEDAVRFIGDCVNITPTTANAEDHARMLHQRAGEARFKLAVQEALEGEDAAAAVAGICQSFLQASAGGGLQSIGQAMKAAWDGLANDRELRIDTGFPKLDGLLKGINAGQLVLIGARPGVGKSAFALDLAEYAARGGHKALIYSLEMLSDELAERLMARKSRVALDKLIDKQLSDEDLADLAAASSSLSQLPITICDSPNVTVQKIRAQARTIKNLELVIIDFMTLLQSTQRYDSRNLEVGAISRQLKILATELRIPIVVLCQLNRTQDETEEPGLMSLRDSGELEQNANKILFLWKIDRDTGTIGVKVAKNRRGKTGIVQMAFDGAHMRFTELTEDYVPPTKKRRGWRGASTQPAGADAAAGGASCSEADAGSVVRLLPVL